MSEVAKRTDGRSRPALRNCLAGPDVRILRKRATGYQLPYLRRWVLLLALVPSLAACTPAIRFPDNFWTLLATADQDGQIGQAQGRALALMHFQKIDALKAGANPDLRKLLDWLDQPPPKYQDPPSEPRPVQPGPAKPPGRTQAQYWQDYARWQFDLAKWRYNEARKEYVFFQKTVATFETNLSELKRLPLGAFLEDDDFWPAAEKYEAARAEWNALYDTAITIIGTNRNLPDWPEFIEALTRADKAAKAITAPFRTALDNTMKNREARITRGNGKLESARDQLQKAAVTVNEAAEMVATALRAYRTYDPEAVVGDLTGIDLTQPYAATATGGAEKEFEYIGSPLIAGGINLVELLSKVGEVHKWERGFLVGELNRRKWHTLECLAKPKENDCAPPGHPKGTESEK